MENYFRMDMDKRSIDGISNLGLAHIGDAVFEVLCRGYLCARGGKTVDNLHRSTVAMVKAPAHRLKAYEYGAVPTVYYYSKFVHQQHHKVFVLLVLNEHPNFYLFWLY